MTEPIHHEITFDAPAARVFGALVDETDFGALSEAAAEIDATPGGAFSLFGGQVEGRTVELVTDELLVQAWRVGAWPAGIYSIARFELREDGERTTLIFDQAGFPSDDRTSLDAGWHAMYWEPMREHLRTA